MVTAGWQEREPDDGELNSLLGGQGLALGLYQRWLDVQERDPEYAAASRAVDAILDEMQDLYLLRLDYALQAVYALQRRAASDKLGGTFTEHVASPVADAVAAVRALDTAHLAHVNQVRREFFARLQPHDRPVIAAHRAEVADLLGSAGALIVAGGHVGVLAEVLHLFNVAAVLRSPVIAWSAGAMALADRIVLFGDRSPQGPGHAEVYGSGLGITRDLSCCRTRGRGCCLTTRSGCLFSPSGSRRRAVSCWRAAAGSNFPVTAPARRPARASWPRTGT